MLRACSRVIAISAVVVALSTVQAAEPETLTLACQGTVTDTSTEKPELISMGVIVNFTARTVRGFGSPAEIPAVDDVVVTFARSNHPTIDGTLDRVTGFLRATYMMHLKNGKVVLQQNYMLKCTPAQRIF